MLFYLAGSGDDNSEVGIKVPKVYWTYTRKSILTLEWIDGIKLTDAERISKANLNRKRMIDEVLLWCCLTYVKQHLYSVDCLQTFPFLCVSDFLIRNIAKIYVFGAII